MRSSHNNLTQKMKRRKNDGLPVNSNEHQNGFISNSYNNEIITNDNTDYDSINDDDSNINYQNTDDNFNNDFNLNVQNAQSPTQLQQYLSQWQLQDDAINPHTPTDAFADNYYFNSYAHFGIHEEMLRDETRTGTYKRAILENNHLFKDKVVLDVGCGTGILALFAAKAGAAHVYCIECSDIVNIAQKIVDLNNFSHIITIIKGKAEEITLPVNFVDIILSEWMGYFLLYENMLQSVLFCRDKWLRKGGLIFPDKAAIFIAAIEDSEYKSEKFNFWDYVYGFDFSCVKQTIMEEPIVDNVDQNAIASSYNCILELDLNTCTIDDLQFSNSFKLIVTRNDFIHAFVAWFDVLFSASHKPIGFTTSPFAPSTHWKQTVFYMRENLIAKENEAIEGTIAIKTAKNHPRALDIAISYKFQGQLSNSDQLQVYKLR